MSDHHPSVFLQVASARYPAWVRGLSQFEYLGARGPAYRRPVISCVCRH
jgi:hypothetical protein